MLRPTLRIPLWAAAGIPVAAYILRSAIRGWSFRPDLPQDAVVGLLLLALIVVVVWNRHAAGPNEAGDGLRPEVGSQHDTERNER